LLIINLPCVSFCAFALAPFTMMAPLIVPAPRVSVIAVTSVLLPASLLRAFVRALFLDFLLRLLLSSLLLLSLPLLLLAPYALFLCLALLPKVRDSRFR
jgi:hypothetical protein